MLNISAFPYKMNLFFVGAPQFQSKFLVLSTRRGERCVIECFPKGDRPLSFSWKRGGKVLDAANEPR